MKKAVMTLALLAMTATAQAARLKIVAQQHLEGRDGIDVHFVIKQNGEMVMYSGRSIPQQVRVSEIQDLRDGDGNLEISLSNGYKLVQTSRFTVDHKAHIYLQKPDGQQIEMFPEVELKLKK